jgi:very-short-patch-repair endonuclease
MKFSLLDQATDELANLRLREGTLGGNEDDDNNNTTTTTTTPEKKPEFPRCSKLLADDEGLAALHVFRELENQSGQKHLEHRIRGFARKHPEAMYESLPTCAWSGQGWDTSVGQQHCNRMVWFVRYSHLETFVLRALQRSRHTQRKRLFLLSKFNIEVENTASLKVPIEVEVLDRLEECCPFRVERQYRIGKYRLDAFIPRLNLAIQVDEGGHQNGNYVPAEELDMDTTLRDRNIVCLRFNPDTSSSALDPASELVKLVWAKTISPDYVCYKRVESLG